MNGQPPKIPSSNMFKLVTSFCIFGRYLYKICVKSLTPCVLADYHMTFVLEFVFDKIIQFEITLHIYKRVKR